jgi:hypothetical protein
MLPKRTARCKSPNWKPITSNRAGRYCRILIGGFNEAPAMFKTEGKYYLLTSGTTGWQPQRLP